jgi:hypothetical protein
MDTECEFVTSHGRGVCDGILGGGGQLKGEQERQVCKTLIRSHSCLSSVLLKTTANK